MSPYKDLVVVNQWLNSEGTDIVRHLVDNSPNKPVDEEDESRRDEEQEQAVVVEDLISGFDDDEDDGGGDDVAEAAVETGDA